MSERHQRSIDLLHAREAELKRIAEFSRTIDGTPEGRAIGEQLEIEAELGIGQAELSIDRLEHGMPADEESTG